MEHERAAGLADHLLRLLGDHLGGRGDHGEDGVDGRGGGLQPLPGAQGVTSGRGGGVDLPACLLETAEIVLLHRVNGAQDAIVHPRVSAQVADQAVDVLDHAADGLEPVELVGRQRPPGAYVVRQARALHAGVLADHPGTVLDCEITARDLVLDFARGEGRLAQPRGVLDELARGRQPFVRADPVVASPDGPVHAPTRGRDRRVRLFHGGEDGAQTGGGYGGHLLGRLERRGPGCVALAAQLLDLVGHGGAGWGARAEQRRGIAALERHDGGGLDQPVRHRVDEREAPGVYQVLV